MDTAETSGWRRGKILGWLGVLLVLVALGAFYGWYKFFRDVPQESWMTETPEMRFRYGSIGAENDAGIPYWIFYVLPRMFPDKLPGPGGYAALGVSWEQGQGAADRLHQEDHRISARGEQLRRLPHHELPRRPEREPGVHQRRARPHAESRGVLPIPRRLREGSALQRRQPDARDQPRDRPAVGRAACLPLPHHPDHQETAARARSAVRVDLSPRLSRVGPRPRRLDESHQVFHDQGAHGQQLRARRYPVDLEPEEVRSAPARR